MTINIKPRLSAKVALATLMATAISGCGTPTNNPSGSSSSSNSSSSNSSSSSSSNSSSSSSSSGSAVINMPLVVAINAGGSSSVAMNNVDYQTDKYSKGGSANSTQDAISGADNEALYQTERYGAYSYEVPVTASGRYTIQMHFAELYLEAGGERSFNIDIEGDTVASNLDLFLEAGHDGAYSLVAENIQVNDGGVTITLVSGTENPTISGFAIYSNDGELDTSIPDPVVIPPGEKFVGNITTRGSVRSDFTQYWDQITPENEGKWGSIEGTRDSYNWGPLDRIYDYARQNGIPVKAHTFVWGAQAPNWINNLSAAEQREEIEEWMSDYCARYPDTAIIDVVNEAVEGHAPAGYAQSAFGNDWITKSFELARKHCPNAILVYNDFNFLTWDTDPIMNLIRPAVESGYVDAVGLQAHSLYDPQVWTAQQIQDKLDLISTLGLPIYVSEYDIDNQSDQQQLESMKMHFPIFYNHPNVVGITLWGYVEGATWRERTGLIQDNGQFKPAMTWLMDYLGR